MMSRVFPAAAVASAASQQCCDSDLDSDSDSETRDTGLLVLA